MMNLKTIWHLQARIREEQGLIELLKSLATTVTSSSSHFDGIPTPRPETSRVENLAVKICDSERRLAELVTAMTSAQIDLAAEILSKVTGTVTAKILILRYVHCRQFNQIAEEMHYSIRTIYNHHSKGVLKFNSCEEVPETTSQPA